MLITEVSFGFSFYLSKKDAFSICRFKPMVSPSETSASHLNNVLLEKFIYYSIYFFRINILSKSQYLPNVQCVWAIVLSIYYHDMAILHRERFLLIIRSIFALSIERV